jgi:hypothetical protein
MAAAGVARPEKARSERLCGFWPAPIRSLPELTDLLILPCLFLGAPLLPTFHSPYQVPTACECKTRPHPACPILVSAVA